MYKLMCFFFLTLLPVNLLLANEITLNTTGKPPLNTPELTGFMDLIAKEAFMRIGFKLNTVQLPAERGLKNVNAGLQDGEMSRIKGLNKIYTNLIRVPEKIMDWEFVAFSNKKYNLNTGWNALAPYSISFINGWKILEKNVPNRSNITKVRTPEQLFSMLYKNRSDLILYERWGGLLYLANNPQLTTIKLQTPPLATKEMFIYLHKKHTALVPELSNALQQVKQDGTYDKILRALLLPLEK